MKKAVRGNRGGARLLARCLHRLYALGTGRRLILRMVLWLDGGEMHSTVYRRIALTYHGVRIGMYSYGVGQRLDRLPPGTEIGRYCSIAEGVVILNGNHPLERKAMHPFFYNPKFKYVDNDLIHRTRLSIGNDVWIGLNALILPAVAAIGDGAVIGAGSVVTKNVPSFAVVAGNPARMVKYRFSEATMRELAEEAWWDKDIDEIAESGLESFLRSSGQGR